MFHGLVEPHRFGEHIVNGNKKYDAITHIHYFGEWAFAVGLTDTLKPSYTRGLIEKLHKKGVNRLHYWSGGEMVIWQLYSKRGRVRGKLIT